MLAIGRALMTRPRLLMLDEPSQGIMPKVVDEIFQAVKRIRDAGMTVLIVEQRMAECLEIADRAYILQTGRVLMQGAASEIRTDPDVRKAYRGSRAGRARRVTGRARLNLLQWPRGPFDNHTEP
jgi:branched-chain amino acid transport system ATP-binding protein